MAVFAITFTIHFDEDYDERYVSVNDAIKAEASGAWWAETTSFYLIVSSKRSAEIADSIKANSDFASSKDLLVVINLSQSAYKIIGHLEDKDITSILSKR